MVAFGKIPPPLQSGGQLYKFKGNNSQLFVGNSDAISNVLLIYGICAVQRMINLMLNIKIKCLQQLLYGIRINWDLQYYKGNFSFSFNFRVKFLFTNIYLFLN